MRINWRSYDKVGLHSDAEVDAFEVFLWFYLEGVIGVVFDGCSGFFLSKVILNNEVRERRHSYEGERVTFREYRPARQKKL